MNGEASAPSFELPDTAPLRIRRFHALWVGTGAGGLPDASSFDFSQLSEDFPLLARIGVDDSGRTLVWRELSETSDWPFGPPVLNAPVQESVPRLSVKRVIGTFEEALENAVPDYFETTSWLHGGRSVSLARLVAPLAAGETRELIALWDIIEPPSAR